MKSDWSLLPVYSKNINSGYYGHKAHFLYMNPAARVVSVEDTLNGGDQEDACIIHG